MLSPKSGNAREFTASSRDSSHLCSELRTSSFTCLFTIIWTDSMTHFSSRIQVKIKSRVRLIEKMRLIKFRQFKRSGRPFWPKVSRRFWRTRTSWWGLVSRISRIWSIKWSIIKLTGRNRAASGILCLWARDRDSLFCRWLWIFGGKKGLSGFIAGSRVIIWKSFSRIRFLCLFLKKSGYIWVIQFISFHN